MTDRFLPKLDDSEIKIAGTVSESIVDGPGVRYVIFTQGCPHRCHGCHNPHTQPFEGGKTIKIKQLYDEIKSNPLIEGVTLSGGEPFCQCAPLSVLAKRLNAEGVSVMAYSGYTFEQLCEKAENDKATRNLLAYTNILVDGPFILEKRDLMLKYRGSSNQRMLDITCYPNSPLIKEID